MIRALLIASLLVGCAHHVERLKPGDEGYVGLKQTLAAQTGCPGEPVIMYTRGKERGQSAGFTGQMCERDFVCESVVDRSNDITNEAACRETPPSQERTSKRIVIDRLVLETGCAKASILPEGEAAWVVGTERAYRFSACGKSYVCTSAAGRAECKAALGQAPAPPAEPPPPPAPTSTL